MEVFSSKFRWKHDEDFFFQENSIEGQAGEAILSKVLETSDPLPDYLEKSMKFRYLRNGEMLFTEGQTPDRWYVLVQGLVRLYREAGEVLQILDEISSGFTLGEFFFFSREKYFYSACALAHPSFVLEISSLSILKYLYENKVFYGRMVRILLGHMKRLDHVTMYHNIFGNNSADLGTALPKENSEKDLSNWELRKILSLQWNLKEISDEQLEELQRAEFPMGYTIVSSNEVTRSSYFLLKGEVKYVIQDDPREGETPEEDDGDFEDSIDEVRGTVVGRRGVGQTVAMTSVLAGLPLLANVIATVDSQAIVFSSQALEWLVRNAPSVVREIVGQRITASFQRLKHFTLGFHYLKLNRNALLYKAGETVQPQVSLVLTGEMVELYPSGTIRSYYGPGNILGVKGVLRGGKRKSSFQALRPTELVVFHLPPHLLLPALATRPRIYSNESFELLIDKSNDQLLKTLLTVRHRKERVGSMGIALTPLHSSLPVEKFAEMLSSHLRPFGRVTCLTRSHVTAAFGLSSLSPDLPPQLPIRYFLNALDERFDFLIFCCDSHSSQWTSQALQQSDCVLLLDSPQVPLGNHQTIDRSIKELIDSSGNSGNTHLVLLQPPQGRSTGKFSPNAFSRMSDRLERRRLLDIQYWHHVNSEVPSDFARLARRISGNAVGLALGGGACRGLAHCGVIRALLEEGIPIDICGGTSAGALVSALYSRGEPLPKMEKLFSDVFQLSHWVGDFTFPWMSLLSGNALQKKMQEIYGKGHMEDLPLPCFAVSTHMNQYKAHLHRKGVLWLALRSSISLPPFLPPVKTKEGILLDGGFVNKVPVEVCRELGAGYVIGVDVSPTVEFGSTLPKNYLAAKSGFKILIEKLTGGPGYLSIMNIMTELGYLIDYNRKPDQGADLFIVPEGLSKYGTFVSEGDAVDIIDKGYRTTKQVLQKLKTSDKDTWKKLAVNPPQQWGPMERASPARKSARLTVTVLPYVLAFLLFGWMAKRWHVFRSLRAFLMRVVKTYYLDN